MVTSSKVCQDQPKSVARNADRLLSFCGAGGGKGLLMLFTAHCSNLSSPSLPLVKILGQTSAEREEKKVRKDARERCNTSDTYNYNDATYLGKSNSSQE